jgi:hypothetical protein
MYEEIIKWLVIGIVGIAITLNVPRIAQNLTLNSTKSQKKLQQLDQDYIIELEDKVKKYKNKANSMEKGPIIEAGSDLSSILPDLIGQFEGFAPKWLQPLLKNPETQKFIVDYATRNPEKLAELFGKITKGKPTAAQEQEAAIQYL